MSTNSKIIKIGYGIVKSVAIGKNLSLVFIGLPCAIESYDHN